MTTITTDRHAAAAQEQQAHALNQLASVLAGRDAAVATNDLIDDPEARLEQLIEMASLELRRAAGAGDQHSLKAAARKAESLGSLLVLAKALAGAA